MLSDWVEGNKELSEQVDIEQSDRLMAIRCYLTAVECNKELVDR